MGQGAVFPTLVGVFPRPRRHAGRGGGLPHARGGVSSEAVERRWKTESSPRSWGCFQTKSDETDHHQVFPTLVGVFPQMALLLTIRSCLPHARGGVSINGLTIYTSIKSSPRSWGCFPNQQTTSAGDGVFPTLVGVFPKRKCRDLPCRRLPHARGGVSADFISATPSERSSPRSWGCFQMVRDCDGSWAVFPTLVGVFPYEHQKEFAQHGLPHARGGVSNVRMSFIEELLSSPRSWGCFLRPSASCCPIPVFPTLVGVFLMSSVVRRQGGRLPHARGGVSSSWPLRSWARPSSPRSWGCF